MQRFWKSPSALFLALLAVGLFSRSSFIFRKEYDLISELSSASSRYSPRFLNQAVLIYLDEESHQFLGQPYDKPWDRSLHAKLINRLAAAGAKLIYVDILFQAAGSDLQADKDLAAAISSAGNVVLVGQLLRSGHGGSARETVATPYTPFREAAAAWGIATFNPDPDSTIRTFPVSVPEIVNAAPLEAAILLRDFGSDAPPKEPSPQSLLLFYRNAPTLSNNTWSYHEVLSEQFSLEKFQDKIVFIGARQTAGYTGSGKDTFRSPLSALSGEPWNGVDFHIVALENLLNRKAIQPLSLPTEFGLVALSGLLLTTSLFFSSKLARFSYLVLCTILLTSGIVFWAEASQTTAPFLTPALQAFTSCLFLVIKKPIRYELFVSYCHEDAKERDFINPLLEAFRRVGLRYWIDRHSIEVANDYRDRISEGIEQSSGYLLLVTRLTPDSKEVFSEIRQARARKLTRIRILVDDVKDDDLEKDFAGELAIDWRETELSTIDYFESAKRIRRSLKISWPRVFINKLRPSSKSQLPK